MVAAARRKLPTVKVHTPYFPIPNYTKEDNVIVKVYRKETVDIYYFTEDGVVDEEEEIDEKPQLPPSTKPNWHQAPPPPPPPLTSLAAQTNRAMSAAATSSSSSSVLSDKKRCCPCNEEEPVDENQKMRENKRKKLLAMLAAAQERLERAKAYSNSRNAPEEENCEEPKLSPSAIPNLDEFLSQFAYTGRQTGNQAPPISPVTQTIKPHRAPSSRRPSKKKCSPCTGDQQEEEKEEEEEKKRKRKRKDSPTFTAAQKRDEAYLRKTPDNYWNPPKSPHMLLQETHACDPWRVMVICILLNRTSGVQVRRILDDFFALCPNAKTATEVDKEEISELTQSLGLKKKRAEIIQRFSQKYLTEDWTHVTMLPGVGKYAADAYAIFVWGNGTG